MKAILLTLLLFAIYPAHLSMNAKPGADDILGEWLTAHKDGKVVIYKKEQKYFGKIVWGKGYDAKDVKNQDPQLRNRDLLGLNILSDFVYDGSNTWQDGTIYLPGAGKTYSCILTLKSPGVLKVRGYVGAPIFGKSELWTRIAK